MSFMITRRIIDGQIRFRVLYSRGMNDGWHNYKQGRELVSFESFNDAFHWLVKRNAGNVAYVLLRLCGTWVEEETIRERARKLGYEFA